MKHHYQTTTDKVLAVIPLAAPQEQMIGGIHLPPSVSRASLDKEAICEIVVHSVGPDCKTVKPGDRVLYNKNIVTPLPCQDGELVVLPEGQVICVVTERAERSTPIVIGTAPKKPLTTDEIRAALDKEDAPLKAEPETAGAAVD